MAETLDLYTNARRHFTVQRVNASDAVALPAAVATGIERAFSQGQGGGRRTWRPPKW